MKVWFWRISCPSDSRVVVLNVRSNADGTARLARRDPPGIGSEPVLALRNAVGAG